MSSRDRRPSPGIPSTPKIVARSDNRLGAVYSALHSFWMARQAAINSSGGGGVRRDAYSVLLHHHLAEPTSIINDFNRTPDQLLDELLPHPACGDNDFEAALMLAQNMMETHWSTERSACVYKAAHDLILKPDPRSSSSFPTESGLSLKRRCMTSVAEL
jgi:hypothetical protein